MKTLEQIQTIISQLDDSTFEKMTQAIDNYFEKGGALKLYNLAKKIGLTIDEIWEWENY